MTRLAVRPRTTGVINPSGKAAIVTKKLFIKTYGCQMNVYDSDRMTDVLAPLGYAPTSQADGADMVILNTHAISARRRRRRFSPNSAVSG